MVDFGPNFHAECIKQRNRPAAFERQAPLPIAQGEDDQRREYSAKTQQDQTKNAKAADRQIGVVQSSCPR